MHRCALLLFLFAYTVIGCDEKPYLPLSDYEYDHHYSIVPATPMIDSVRTETPDEEEILNSIILCRIIAANRFIKEVPWIRTANINSRVINKFDNTHWMEINPRIERQIYLHAVKMNNTWSPRYTDYTHYCSKNGKWKISLDGTIVTFSYFPFDGAYHLKCDDFIQRKLDGYELIYTIHTFPRQVTNYLIPGYIIVSAIIFEVVLFKASIIVFRWLVDKLAEWLNSYRDYPHDLLCRICMDRPRNLLYLPCKHIIACDKCGYRLNECPLCRKEITQTCEVFIS